MAKRLISTFRSTNNTDKGSIISVTLARNLSAYKQTERDLFSEITQEEAIKLQRSDSVMLVDRRGKTVSLSRIENRVLHSLGLPLRNILNEEEVKLHIKQLSHAIRTGDLRDYPKTNISVIVNVTELSRLLNGTAKDREINKIEETLRSLEAKRQVVTIYGDKDENGVETATTIVTPFIMIDGEIEKRKDGRTIEAYIKVVFGSAFLNKILSRYAILPRKLFSIWGKQGSGTTTELFDTLLDLLLSQFWLRLTQYKNARKNVYTKHKKRTDRVEKDEFLDEIQKEQNRALRYEESMEKILLRVSTDYSGNNKMKQQLKKDLDGAFKALKEIGLVTEATIIKGAIPKLSFKINPDYCKEDVKAIQQAEETIEAEEA